MKKRFGSLWSKVVTHDSPFSFLGDFFVDRFPQIAQEEWHRRFEAGDVCLENGESVSYQTSFSAHLTLFYKRHVPHEAEVPERHEIIYENDHIIVADKPHGLATLPGGKHLKQTLQFRLEMAFDQPLTPLHRLDRETAGLVIFARQEDTRSAYHRLFQDGSIAKQYEAVCWKERSPQFPIQVSTRLEPGEPFFKMNSVPGEPNSETQVHLKQDLGSKVWLELSPKTGKKHQLRVHLAEAGLPIVNDPIYGAYPVEGDMQLLANGLEFIDPITQEQRVFQSQFTLKK